MYVTKRKTLGRNLGELLPYGPNTYYDGSTGEYISATGQRYKSPQEMNAAAMAANFSPTYDYNHTQWASDATAQQVAQNTGGSVVRSEVYGGAMPTWNLIDYGGQDKFNAGLVAQLYATYPKWQADAMLAAEQARSGGSYTAWSGPTVEQVKAASQPAPTTNYLPDPEPPTQQTTTTNYLPDPAPAAPSGSQTSVTTPTSGGTSNVSIDNGRVVVSTPTSEIAFDAGGFVARAKELLNQIPTWVWIAGAGLYLYANRKD
ncbi:MAG: hypothetical protein IT160_07065 [Bryobacterales bacterium]|nr:hypothetical protein [Bryobacterales bacterium]